MGIEPMNEILKHHCSRKVLHFTQRRTHKWIQNESYEDYMYLVERCLKHEKEIVSPYLPATTQDKIIQVVEHELLQEKASELEGKK
ncbi:hypothetical protein MANES_07G121604v8 [Manihot esculenta]|uniref:Uncharacterized protein n=1 Tax=Manihot esculenta TaxID=3983 RepID=A0ACB7HHF4_MANES|nr:hypothetical protein MANES_07G121604v8 [Manihot esculenta]